jgi:hypothetical protein
MDDVTVLRIRTPPPDEVMEERVRLRRAKNELSDMVLAGLVALLLLMITIWARTNPKRG